MMEDERGSHFDPEVLDASKPMTMDLYSACSGSSSQELDVRLGCLCSKYFSSDVHEWISSLSQTQGQAG